MEVEKESRREDKSHLNPCQAMREYVGLDKENC